MDTSKESASPVRKSPAAATHKILVVDDEPSIVEAVTYNLRQQGYETLTAGDADTALRLVQNKSPDLLILDVMLPSGSGFEVCRILRQKGSQIPILMLTARIAEADRVQGLEIGADDYLVKPFGMRELMARVKALLRRGSTPLADADTSGSGAVVSSSGLNLTINTEKREANLNGEPLTLSRKEFDLLTFFVSYPGRVFDRQTLLARVWGEDAFIDDRTVDVHVRWLREKIEPIPGKPQFLLTARGVGYKFSGG